MPRKFTAPLTEAQKAKHFETQLSEHFPEVSRLRTNVAVLRAILNKAEAQLFAEQLRMRHVVMKDL